MKTTFSPLHNGQLQPERISFQYLLEMSCDSLTDTMARCSTHEHRQQRNIVVEVAMRCYDVMLLCMSYQVLVGAANNDPLSESRSILSDMHMHGWTIIGTEDRLNDVC